VTPLDVRRSNFQRYLSVNHNTDDDDFETEDFEAEDEDYSLTSLHQAARDGNVRIIQHKVKFRFSILRGLWVQ
jgi:hypothetical protein